MKGTITRLRQDKGFGFVRTEGDNTGKGDHFLHARSMLGGISFADLKVGDVIEFDSEVGEKGLVAVRAQLSS